MSSRRQRIENRLLTVLQPSVYDIIDESSQHTDSTSAESHLKLIIVSDKFISLNRVARHRWIYQILQEEFDSGLHALSLALYSPEEWTEDAPPLASPLCHRKKNR